MKIGILTQPLHANYGGLLQNYALQQILLLLGHNPETIDWGAPSNFRTHLSYLKFRFTSLFSHRSTGNTYKITKKEKQIIQCNTDYFISKYIRHTKVLSSHSSFKRQSVLGSYDAYIVGSDQCWRPSYNCFLYEMFLSFVANKQVKRIAYAASFGSDKWEFTKNQTEACSRLAKKFDIITVREDSGVDLCKRNLGVDAMHVLDPTMLLSKDIYSKLVVEENESKSDGTLFYYVLDPNQEKNTFIQMVAKELNLVSFTVLPKFQAETRTKSDVKNRISDCVFPSVTSWLRAFMDAELTIVDSFHGMVFSIIFNKPFWVIGNPKRGMSRFLSLLKLLNLEDRLIDIDNCSHIDLKQKIDWNRTNQLIDFYKKQSIELLKNSLS